MENMIIFLTPLADHFTCFKQKLLKKFFRKQDIISYVIFLSIFRYLDWKPKVRKALFAVICSYRFEPT